MIRGMIKTSHILSHPVLLIKLRGLRGYMQVLKKALSPKTYHYIQWL